LVAGPPATEVPLERFSFGVRAASLDAWRNPVSGEGLMYGFIWASSFLVLSMTSSVVLCGGLIGWPIAPELKWGLIAGVALLMFAGALGLLSVPSAGSPEHRA
jgi:hypothetical protein